MTWTLYEGDCLEIMPTLQDKVDMILCDLPYGTTQNAWDSVIPLDRLWQEYRRLIKDNGAIVLTAQTPFDKVLGCSNLPWLRYEWIWEKDQGTGHLNANKMPLKIHENVLLFYQEMPTYNPQMERGKPYTQKRKPLNDSGTNYGYVQRTHTINKGQRYPQTIKRFARETGLHPTQKPVALFEYLIRTYTNYGDTILDNCAGSGTAGVAAENLGRNSIMIERDPKYCDIIRKRMANRQTTLFEMGAEI